MLLNGSGAAALSRIARQAEPVTHQVGGHDQEEQRNVVSVARLGDGYARQAAKHKTDGKNRNAHRE
jgi:hypothetical protein